MVESVIFEIPIVTKIDKVVRFDLFPRLDYRLTSLLATGIELVCLD